MISQSRAAVSLSFPPSFVSSFLPPQVRYLRLARFRGKTHGTHLLLPPSSSAASSPCPRLQAQDLASTSAIGPSHPPRRTNPPITRLSIQASTRRTDPTLLATPPARGEQKLDLGPS